MADGKEARPARDRRALQDDKGRPGPGRKDTRRWCRGVPGREHAPEIVIPANYTWPFVKCRPAAAWMGRPWTCWHVEECTVCGKRLRSNWGESLFPCPNRPHTNDAKEA